MREEMLIPPFGQRVQTRQKQTIPAQPTPLIGRQREVAMARQLLRHADVRLLTITGPGGVGKTRLAIQVAVDLLNDFPDGLSFVSLAPISDPQLVVPTIAQTLGLREACGRPFYDLLREYLLDKQLLLLLDNFEQVAKAAPSLAELLSTCSDVKILVTSRAALHLRAEYEFPVAPLLRPDLKRLPALKALSQYAAIAVCPACAGSEARFRADRGECSGGRRNLCSSGWVTTGHRVGGCSRETPLATSLACSTDWGWWSQTPGQWSTGPAGTAEDTSYYP